MLPHLGGTENQKFMTNWKIIIIVCEIYNSKSKWPMLLNMSIHYNIFFAGERQFMMYIRLSYLCSSHHIIVKYSKINDVCAIIK